MSDQDASGSNDRATVALVLSEVRTVTAKIDGVNGAMLAGFANTQRQLDTLAGIPERVARLEEHDRSTDDMPEVVSALTARVSGLEREVSWRRGPLFAAVVGVFLGAFTGILPHVVPHIFG